MSKPVKTMWVAKQAAEKLDIYLYDDIAADGRDWWTGEVIESDTSAKHMKNILDAAGNVSQINIFINSYGGDVSEAMAIYNQLKRHSAHKTVYVDGFACSAASVIAMVGDDVVMGSNTLMMIHHAWLCACGNPKELRKAADDLEVIDTASCKAYLEKAGDKLDEATLTTLLDAESWLDAETCVKYGLADRIAAKESVEDVAQQRLDAAKAQALAIERGNPAPAQNVPQEFTQNKTIAEQLMAAFATKKE